MNRFKKILAPVSCAFFMLGVITPVSATDYSDEEYWYETCTKVQTTREGVTACQGFQEYQKAKKEELNQSIASFNSSIDKLTQDTSEIEALALEQKELSESLQLQISDTENAIAAIEYSIADTVAAIDQKQAEIDAYDDQIKTRMKAEQSQTGTNSFVDLIMGSTSLADMLRRITGIERITESDQMQIEDLKEMKEELAATISGLAELNEQNKEMLAELEEQKTLADEMQASYEKLVEEYEEQLAQLEAEKRSVEIDLEEIKDFVINVDLSAALFASVPNSSGFITPVQSGRVSAGTWAYASGGLHLGLDLAAPVGTDLLAPAGGIIIYASNSQPSNGGYLGNWAGWPYGSGNYLEMVCEVNGQVYAIGFAHLSNEFYVQAGDVVSQGDVIAKTGNSGNSSGAHTHIEVYNLGDMTLQEAVEQFKSKADFTFGAGWGSTATACEYTSSKPCRERPESLLLN